MIFWAKFTSIQDHTLHHLIKKISTRLSKELIIRLKCLYGFDYSYNL